MNALDRANPARTIIAQMILAVACIGAIIGPAAAPANAALASVHALGDADAPASAPSEGPPRITVEAPSVYAGGVLAWSEAVVASPTAAPVHGIGSDHISWCGSSGMDYHQDPPDGQEPPDGEPGCMMCNETCHYQVTVFHVDCVNEAGGFWARQWCHFQRDLRNLMCDQLAPEPCAEVENPCLIRPS